MGFLLERGHALCHRATGLNAEHGHSSFRDRCWEWWVPDEAGPLRSRGEYEIMQSVALQVEESNLVRSMKLRLKVKVYKCRSIMLCLFLVSALKRTNDLAGLGDSLMHETTDQAFFGRSWKWGSSTAASEI